MNQKDVNLLAVLLKLVENRWLIIKIVLSITLLSLIISLVWPKSYKSTVRFFPPPRQGAGFPGFLGGLFQPTVTTQEINPEAILVILRSRSLMERVIRKFNFAEIYGNDKMEILLKQLASNIEIHEIREGGFGFNPLIAVEFSFIDENPERAEAVTEYYIHQLDSILKQLNKERAYYTYKIIEKRYRENVKELQNAELNFKNFQQRFGVFQIETQMEELIKQVAELKAQLVQTEIQLEILKNTVSRDNPQYLQLINQRNAIKKQYAEMLREVEGTENEFFQPLEKMPELALQYAKLFREVTVQNKIYEFVYPQYEQMRLQVEMQSQGIQILDPAKVPTYKYKPKRIYIVLAGLTFGIFFALFVVFVKDFYESEKRKNSQNYQYLSRISASLRKDWPFRKSRHP